MELSVDNAVNYLKKLEQIIIINFIYRAQICLNEYKLKNSGLEQNPSESNKKIFTVPRKKPYHFSIPNSNLVVERPNFSNVEIFDSIEIDLLSEIKEAHRSTVEEICKKGHDEFQDLSKQYDTSNFEAISERIIYGAKSVAEAKFREEVDAYSELIKAKDKEGLIKKLTRKDKEDEICDRIYEKVNEYQKNANPLLRSKIEPEILVRFYKKCMIELTKEGQAIYLFQRLDHPI